MMTTVGLPAWFGRAALVTFFLTQVFDGMLTYVGVITFGPTAEGNPIVATYISVLGAGTALIAVKAFASACAVLLYFNQRHREVAALAILYGAAAVWPWMIILSNPLF
jgi:hypothetical protein